MTANGELLTSVGQVEMEDEGKEMTAFRTEDGLYQFKRTPLRLTNAPASFQHMINAVFPGLEGINLQVFEDYLCLATETWDEHLQMLSRIIKAVTDANRTLKGEVCVIE